MSQLNNIADQVERFLADIDAQVEALQKRVPLKCQAGCGKCCENPQVECTVLEVIGLARFLVQTGQAQRVYQAIQDHQSKQCVLYAPDWGVPGNGRCSQYQHRPMICRLFGFAVSKDKNGKARLASCPLVLKTSNVIPDQIAWTSTEGLPVYSESWMALTGIHPEWAVQRFPINEAIRLAIEKVGLMMQFADERDFNEG